MAERSFNGNGYKTMKVLVFGDLADKVYKLTIGTVIGLINPKPLKRDPKHGFSFAIDFEAQMMKIGYSEEITTCKGIAPKEFMGAGGMKCT